MLAPVLLLLLIQTGWIVSSEVKLEALMPNVSPKSPDAYICHKIKLDESEPVYITEFEAKSTKEIAHHILLFACSDPGPEETWNCGEMLTKSGDKQFKSGPVCSSRQNIVFAWALDAPKLVLPKGVGFKLGGDTENKYLVVQVHYANVDNFKNGATDDSGIILRGQTEPLHKLAGVYLMATNGFIPAQQEEKFEAACQMNEDKVIHPFAYRTHAHKLAIVNSGYLVSKDEKTGKQKWTEIGRRSPQLPQMFFPASNDVAVKKGDVLAARCTMYNFRDHLVRIGSTGEDEMCNFYIMYWVDGENLLTNNMCYTGGPPHWYFKDFKGDTIKSLSMDEVPENASEVPDVQKEELEGMKNSGGMHGMHNMDHSNNHKMEHEQEPTPIKTKSKYTDRIVQILREYENRYRRMESVEEESVNSLEELERALTLKRLMNELELN